MLADRPANVVAPLTAKVPLIVALPPACRLPGVEMLAKLELPVMLMSPPTVTSLLTVKSSAITVPLTSNAADALGVDVLIPILFCDASTNKAWV